MSYLGFVKTLCEGYLAGFPEPRVLEIGVHRGQTALPLIHNLSLFSKFTYVGLDILPCKLVIEQVSQYANVSLLGLDERTGRDVILQHVNSLDWLEASKKSGQGRFDLVLVDGDHNYKTVTKELELIQAVIHPMSIIVCDDYNGQWAETDLYYSDRDEYKDNEKATKKEESDKQGVKTAVHDFLEENKTWSSETWGNLDPVILYRNDVWEKFELTTEESPDVLSSTRQRHRSNRQPIVERDVKLTAHLRSMYLKSQ